MLECNVSFSYGSKKRLNVDFNLSSGIIGLFGQNGSGKSTLLKILGGSLPASGAIKIDGHNAIGSDGFLKASVRKDLGILFQETSSDDKISAFDNLFYASLLMGFDKNEAKNQASETLKLSGLEERAYEPVKKLSGGMRRRLELYRTFLHNPKIVLLDEPTAGLDVKETSRFGEFLKAYQEKTDALVIIASHSPEELLMCTRVLFLAEGVLLADDSPEKLLGALDYLCLSLKLKGEIAPALKLTDMAHDKKNGLLTGKISAQKLDALLTDQAFFKNDLVKGFTVDMPTLADAYRTLTTSRGINAGHL